MASAETFTTTTSIPSGYEAAWQLPETALIGGDTLPWMDQSAELKIAHIALQGGNEFFLASAVGTHDKLVEAADGLSRQQQQNADNMFYSRLPGFIENGHAPNIETLPKPSTDSP
ncbi:MAG TPA: hypothetical protein VGO07_01020, partial [Candidatus Saccharimonadales bacterium]|nr:hypothetical protein [Candidatus Saccharimonadales bacterium]